MPQPFLGSLDAAQGHDRTHVTLNSNETQRHCLVELWMSRFTVGYTLMFILKRYRLSNISPTASASLYSVATRPLTLPLAALRRTFCLTNLASLLPLVSLELHAHLQHSRICCCASRQLSFHLSVRPSVTDRSIM